MTSISLPVYEDRIVAFVDILGFTELVSELSGKPTNHEALHLALTTIKSHIVRPPSIPPPEAEPAFESSVFSDCIAISAAPKSLMDIVLACVSLQAKLLKLSILTRGGIAIGPVHHSEGILYGEGLIKAIHLEKKAAVYPRVLIDSVLIGMIDSAFRHVMLRCDVDGMWHTNPFPFVGLQLLEGVTPTEGGTSYSRFLRDLVSEAVGNVEKYHDSGIKAKWGWMKTKANLAQEELRKHHGLWGGPL